MAPCKSRTLPLQVWAMKEMTSTGIFKPSRRNLIAQDIHTQLDIRLLQLADQTARETGEQTVWHILQLYRRAVARQDNTLSVAEEVVEDMEEGIQCLRLTSPLLDIIHNQHIDRLIEVDEIIARIMEHGIGILGLERRALT